MAPVYAENETSDTTQINYEVSEAYEWMAPVDFSFTQNSNGSEAHTATVKVIKNVIGANKTLKISIANGQEFELTDSANSANKRTYTVKDGATSLTAGSEVLTVPSGTNTGSKDMQVQMDSETVEIAGTYSGTLKFVSEIVTNVLFSDMLDIVAGGILKSNGENYNETAGTYDQSHYRTNNYIEITDDTNIYIKAADGYCFIISFYGDNKSFLGRTADAVSTVLTECDINIDNTFGYDAKYFRVTFCNFDNHPFEMSEDLYTVYLSSYTPISSQTPSIFKRSASITEIGSLNNSTTHIAQGSCINGDVLYYFEGLDWNDPYNSVEVTKYNLTSNTADKMVLSGEHLGHCNDATYNTVTNQVLVAVTNNGEIAVFDSDMNYIESVYPKINGVIVNSYGIAYNKSNNTYILGLYDNEGIGEYAFAVFDAEWNHVKTLEPFSYSPYVRQGIETDGEYIYRSLYTQNSVDIYDMEGNYLSNVSVGIDGELECIEIDNDGNVYITSNYHGSYTGTVIYDVVLRNDL